MNFPNDADGDVLRRMHARGFDFSKKYLVDFNVDFESWPPPESAVAMLRREFPSTTIYEPSGDDRGYVQFQVFELVTYDLVTQLQAHVSENMAPYGGTCDSWGVLHG